MLKLLSMSWSCFWAPILIVNIHVGRCRERESDGLHQRHLMRTGSRMHCASGTQAAPNVEPIRSLVHQMAFTSLDSYSPISCKEWLSLSVTFCSNSVSSTERAPRWWRWWSSLLYRVYSASFVPACLKRELADVVSDSSEPGAVLSWRVPVHLRVCSGRTIISSKSPSDHQECRIQRIQIKTGQGGIKSEC